MIRESRASEALSQSDVPVCPLMLAVAAVFQIAIYEWCMTER
jgi:hypothetical protein